MRSRLDQTFGRKRRLRGGVVGDERHAVAQYLLCDRPADVHRLVFSVQSIETKHDTRIERVAGRQQNRAALCWYDFEEQLDQPLQQVVKPADRVDAGADLHQRTQIARHHVHRVVDADLERRSADYLRFVDVHFTGPRREAAFFSEKDELRVADPDPVAMLKNARLDWQVVDE